MVDRVKYKHLLTMWFPFNISLNPTPPHHRHDSCMEKWNENNLKVNDYQTILYPKRSLFSHFINEVPVPLMTSMAHNIMRQDINLLIEM